MTMFSGMRVVLFPSKVHWASPERLRAGDQVPCCCLHSLLPSHASATGRIGDIEGLLQEGVRTVTAEDWAKCCRHVIGLEKRYWEDDGMMEDIEPVVVRLGSDSSSSDTEDEDQ